MKRKKYVYSGLKAKLPDAYKMKNRFVNVGKNGNSWVVEAGHKGFKTQKLFLSLEALNALFKMVSDISHKETQDLIKKVGRQQELIAAEKEAK